MGDAELYYPASGAKHFDFYEGYMKALYDLEEPEKSIVRRMRIRFNTLVYEKINKYFFYFQ
jgi:hypothetical protein